MKRQTAISWRMDETYIKVKGKWRYLCRAVDRSGKTLDFMLSERRNAAAARRFFKRAIGANGVPDRVVIDKSGANLAGLQRINIILKFTGPKQGFKAFHSVAATIAGIETAHMIRKGQVGPNGLTAAQQFAGLAA